MEVEDQLEVSAAQLDAAALSRGDCEEEAWIGPEMWMAARKAVRWCGEEIEGQVWRRRARG